MIKITLIDSTIIYCHEISFDSGLAHWIYYATHSKGKHGTIPVRKIKHIQDQ